MSSKNKFNFKEWEDAGFNLESAKEWFSVGLNSPEEAKKLTSEKVPPEVWKYMNDTMIKDIDYVLDGLKKNAPDQLKELYKELLKSDPGLIAAAEKLEASTPNPSFSDYENLLKEYDAKMENKSPGKNFDIE